LGIMVLSTSTMTSLAPTSNHFTRGIFYNGKKFIYI
jgi:hypothetical protein